ncbi:MAG: histidine phosphatase family protein [Oscillospiraceae bacterium]|nr:histidine phosphatase family protein [Oscillospiraceae bacterium]
MVRFVIVRHGFSEGNREKRFSGQMDVPLDAAGKKQAQSVAKYVCDNFKIDAIYSSDLIRAYDTAKPCAEALGLEINTCKELREVDVGAFTGVLIEEVKVRFKEAFENYRQNPGIAQFPDGESYGDMLKRALSAIEKIAAENDGKTVLIATHGGVVRVLRAHWLGISLEDIGAVPHVPNASVTVAEYFDADHVNLTQIGYTDHLEEKASEVGFN